MRTIGLVAIAITGLGMTGCSQISSVFKKKPHYHTNDGTAVYVGSEASLRTTPQQSYQFAKDSYQDSYQGSYQDRYVTSPQYASPTYKGTQTAAAQYTSSPFSGYSVELYNAQPASHSAVSFSDPRDAEFVKLNGGSNIVDWQNCETQHRGYLFASEYNFSLNPEFEVCMRNKGYVLTSEYRSSSKEVLNAQKARLRGPVQFTPTQLTPTVSAYPGYFR